MHALFIPGSNSGNRAMQDAHKQREGQMTGFLHTVHKFCPYSHDLIPKRILARSPRVRSKTSLNGVGSELLEKHIGRTLLQVVDARTSWTDFRREFPSLSTESGSLSL